MKRKVCTTALIAFLMLLLINVGTTKASEPDYERLERQTVVEPTIDGFWTSNDEWTEGEPTMIGENVVFRSTYTLTGEGEEGYVCTSHFVIEILNDNSYDAGDYWQFCIDGLLDGGSAPQTDDFRIDIVGHTDLVCYQGTGSGWTEITPDPSDVIFANSISESPTSSTPHWILETSLLKHQGVITMDIVWGVRVAVYDESNSAAGVQAWPPTDRDVPDEWGINNFTEDPYEPTNQVATPTFSPAPGTYSSAQSVTISCSTSDATIRYTTNGADPTSSSPVYTDPISVSSGSVTIKAIAFKSGMTASDIASATYTIEPPPQQVATPTFSPAPGTYSSAQSVTISCSTSGAIIRCTTDGAYPTSSSPVYTDPISVSSGSVTIKARAFKSGWTASDIASAAYTIEPRQQQVATPTFSPAAGTYSSAQSVTISCNTSDATICYTTDGADPTSSSPVYTSPISVSSGSVTIKARAFKSGWTDSDIASAAYTIQPPQVATPTFSPAAGTYSSAQSVTISCSTSGATIRYTLDGSTPTSASTVYSSPISVGSGSVTIKARAFRSGWTDSNVATGTYHIDPIPISVEWIAAIISLCGLTAGAGGWIFRSYSARKRHKILFTKLMEDIDDVYTRFRMNTLRCETELYRYKNQVLEDFKQGLIDEEKYNILDGRIDNYMKEIEEEKGKERQS